MSGVSRRRGAVARAGVRAAIALQIASGCAFPLARTGSSSRYSIASRVTRYVASPTRIPPLGASAWRREAVLTTSPVDDPLARARLGVERDERLAAVDRDPEVERGRERVADRERGADGAFGVVLMRHRRAERGHDRIADELLDRSAESLDLCAYAFEVRTLKRPHVLRIELLRLRVKPIRSQKRIVTSFRSSRGRGGGRSREGGASAGSWLRI